MSGRFSLIGRVLVSLLVLPVGVLVWITSCGGDGPARPQQSPLSGVWATTYALAEVRGGGGCVTEILEVFETSIGDQSNVQVRVFESDSSPSAVAAVATDTNNSSCTFEGEVAADRFTLEATSCTHVGIGGIECPSGRVVDLSRLSDTLEGTVAGDQISGRAEEVWSLRDAQTEALLGEVSLRSDVSGSRGP